MSDFTNNVGTPNTARITAKRDLVTIPTLWKWVAEGKVFEAGLGMEDTAIAMLAAINDQTASCSLQAPVSTTTLIIPIMTKIAILDDGSALTDISVAFTKPAGLTAAAFTLSGTAMTSKHCLYRTGGAAKASQSATALTGVTVSVLVAADYVEYARAQADDAFLTAATSQVGYNTMVFNFLKDGAPHILSAGAAMLITVKNGTTDGTFKPYFMWAEVSIDDLL